MRNIHIIPTDNINILVQQIWRRKNGGLFKPTNSNPIANNLETLVNIYITSDEQVNRYDYYINNNECIQAMLVPVTSKCKKIILTTDRDLIENGVQSIDDELLEWFVNNPSCEFIKTYPLSGNKYDMIIPQVDHKEEPSQVTFEQAVMPLMKWLSENSNPHATAIVTCRLAELVEGISVFKTDEFLID